MAASSRKRRKKNQKPQSPPLSAPNAAPPPAAEPGQATAGESRSQSRRDLIKNAGLAVGGAAAGWGLAYFFAPQQEVRAQQAVQKAQEKEARTKGPIAATAVYRWLPDDPFGWAFPGQLSAELIRRLQGNPDAYAPRQWAQDVGGVGFALYGNRDVFGLSRIRMTLRGQWVRPVQIVEIRAQVKRFAPLAGTLVWAGSQGGNSIIDIGFDLDADDVVARTRRHYCEWDIHLDVDVDGVRQPLVVRDGNRPFQTTAPAASYSTRYFYKLYSSPAGWKATGPGGLK